MLSIRVKGSFSSGSGFLSFYSGFNGSGFNGSARVPPRNLQRFLLGASRSSSVFVVGFGFVCHVQVSAPRFKVLVFWVF